MNKKYKEIIILQGDFVTVTATITDNNSQISFVKNENILTSVSKLQTKDPNVIRKHILDEKEYLSLEIKDKLNIKKDLDMLLNIDKLKDDLIKKLNKQIELLTLNSNKQPDDINDIINAIDLDEESDIIKIDLNNVIDGIFENNSDKKEIETVKPESDKKVLISDGTINNIPSNMKSIWVNGKNVFYDPTSYESEPSKKPIESFISKQANDSLFQDAVIS